MEGRNYVEVAVAYAKGALADATLARHSRWVRLAAIRFFKDLKRCRQADAPFYFDFWAAMEPCKFIENLPHVEGEWGTPNIELHPAHIFFIVNLFGFRLANGTRRFTSALLLIGRKNAKALALATPIPTPSGWRQIGDINAGDFVFGSSGAPCRVLATSKIFTGKPCYRVEFSDGSHIVASGDHQWQTSCRFRPWDDPTIYSGGSRRGNGSGNGGRRRVGVVTTEQIAQSVRIKRPDGGVEYNHTIDVAGALQTPDVALPLDPYLLGAWLGDGNTDTAQITSGDEDLEFILSQIRRAIGGEPTASRGRTAWRIGLTTGRGGKSVKVVTMLRSMGVLGNKHIPNAYLWSGTDQRRALLQGLMDTDGSIAPTGKSGAMACTFVSTRQCLADGVLQLARSLGIKATIAEGVAKLHGRVIGPRYLVQFTAWAEDRVFRLPRKAVRLQPKPDGQVRSSTLKIVACEQVASVPTKCLSVDSADHLFLAGPGMVATHNTLLAAGILLYCLCCEPEPGAKVISAATTGDQAKIIFKAAKAMVDKTHDLREAFGLESFSKSIARPEEGSVFVPINAKASTQDGLNPSHVGLDEIHAHKDHDLLNVLRSAAGARKNTLWLYTTTEGYETPGPWPELRKNAQNILLGVYDDDKTLALMFCLDDDIGRKGDADYREQDDEFDESKWVKANPLMEVNPELLTAIRNHADDAKRMPGQMAEFRIKRCNRQAAAATAWLRIPEWKRCRGAVNLDWLVSVGAPCWGGLDGASTTDIMAWRLVWRWEGIVYTWGRRWVPQDAVKQRTERMTVPYQAWVEMGFIKMTPGVIINYDVVEEDIVTDFERFHPEIIGYDAWNVRELVGRLKKRIPQRRVTVKNKTTMEDRLVEFIQGPKSFNPAMKEAERLYLSGNLRHGDDPVLNWCTANVVPRLDVNLNQAPDRVKSADKIDDAVAFFEAIGVMGVLVEEPKKPQLMFV